MPSYKDTKKLGKSSAVMGFNAPSRKSKDTEEDYPSAITPSGRKSKGTERGGATLSGVGKFISDRFSERTSAARAANRDAANARVPGTKRATGAGRTGEMGAMPMAPEKSKKMTMGTTSHMAAPKKMGMTKSSVMAAAKPTQKSEWETMRDRQGDYYLALSGGYGSEPYRTPKKKK